MTDPMTLCLAGDVMTGRGVDQILPSPVDPRLWEQSVHDARDYVGLAERASGPVPRGALPAWPWGDALAVLDDLAPALRIANLETAITARGDPAPRKAVHYRMHPANVSVLTTARLDACSVANNHVLDFGPTGLRDTLGTLAAIGLPAVGAGDDLDAAQRPATLDAGGRRVVVVACGATDSGIPSGWAARAHRAGVDTLPDLGDATAEAVAARARAHAGAGDLVVVSVHWGANWGYEIPADHVRFAHRLVDSGVDLVHGHSSHHPLRAEIHRGRLILYGCGDLIDDYEGIGGYERYRDDLRILWLPTVDAAGALVRLRLAPFVARRLRLWRANRGDTVWLRDLMARLCERPVRVDADGLLELAV